MDNIGKALSITAKIKKKSGKKKILSIINLLSYNTLIGQPLKTQHRCLFLTLSFNSLLLSLVLIKQKSTHIVYFFCWRKNREKNYTKYSGILCTHYTIYCIILNI